MPYIIGQTSESQIVKIAVLLHSNGILQSIPFTSAISYHELTMADDIDEQVTAHIREILRLVLDVKGRSLRNLNELVGETSKFELQPITNVHTEVMIVQNYHVEIGQGEASSLPICVEFKHLRRSNRLPPTKRDYRKMQSPSSGTGRLPKKL
jgi:hypothetical protein